MTHTVLKAIKSFAEDTGKDVSQYEVGMYVPSLYTQGGWCWQEVKTFDNEWEAYLFCNALNGGMNGALHRRSKRETK